MDRRQFMKLGLVGLGAIATASDAMALQFYPKPSDNKWAVLFGTWCGSSRDAGIWISEGLGGIADVFDVRENPDLRGYDHLVVGSSIRYEKISPTLKGYIEKNKPVLKDKVRGLYAVCGGQGQKPGPTKKERYLDGHLSRILETSPALGAVFSGRMTPELLSKEDYTAMEFYSKQMGIDYLKPYDNLSRFECLTFGKQILKSV